MLVLILVNITGFILILNVCIFDSVTYPWSSTTPVALCDMYNCMLESIIALTSLPFGVSSIFIFILIVLSISSYHISVIMCDIFDLIEYIP